VIHQAQGNHSRRHRPGQGRSRGKPASRFTLEIALEHLLVAGGIRFPAGRAGLDHIPEHANRNAASLLEPLGGRGCCSRARPLAEVFELLGVFSIPMLQTTRWTVPEQVSPPQAIGLRHIFKQAGRGRRGQPTRSAIAASLQIGIHRGGDSAAVVRALRAGQESREGRVLALWQRQPS